MIAKPIAASAAATVKINIVNICPTISPENIEKAIKFFGLFVKQVLKIGYILCANIRNIVWSVLKYLQLDTAH